MNNLEVEGARVTTFWVSCIPNRRRMRAAGENFVCPTYHDVTQPVYAGRWPLGTLRRRLGAVAEPAGALLPGLWLRHLKAGPRDISCGLGNYGRRLFRDAACGCERFQADFKEVGDFLVGAATASCASALLALGQELTGRTPGVFQPIDLLKTARLAGRRAGHRSADMDLADGVEQFIARGALEQSGASPSRI